MHAVLRAFLLAFGASRIAAPLPAQPPELPPIFAPKPRGAANDTLVVRRPAPSGAISERMRAQLTALARAKAAEAAAAPTPSNAVDAQRLEVTADGALLMQRFVVKSVGPSPEEVRPPDLPLYHFAPSSRVDRRVKAGYSATLLRFLGDAGSVNFSVVNGAGQGVDHSIDFTRVELGVSFRW